MKHRPLLRYISLFLCLIVLSCFTLSLAQISEGSHLFLIRDKWKYGYINKSGKIIVEPKIAVAGEQVQLPRFEDFYVSEAFKGKPASVKLSSRRAREFRTMLRTDAEQGVNFAGHYVVATWGCGSDCRSIAIIDARNGNVYFTPSLLWIGGLPYQKLDRLQFRRNSRLLVAAGARNDQGSGKYFYVWKNNVLKLIRAVEVRDWKEESSP